MLTDADVNELGLDGDVGEFHAMVKKLRDHYASRHVNPREAFTIGAAQANDGRPTGVAVVSTPRPLVDDVTVRLLGRVAYALSGLLDTRMQQARSGCWRRPGGSPPASSAGCRCCTCPTPDRLTGTRASASRYSVRSGSARRAARRPRRCRARISSRSSARPARDPARPGSDDRREVLAVVGA